MLNIVQASQYVDWELPDVQARFRKGRGTRYQIANIHWIIEKAREFQENICFIDYAKAFDCLDHNKLWKILQEMGIPDHLTCLLRNLYAGQEAVRTGHGTTAWFQIRKLTSLFLVYDSVHFSSVAQLCPTLCDPMYCSTPGFPVLHYLPDFARTHVLWVNDLLTPQTPSSSHP